jgi:hypothetical protein
MCDHFRVTNRVARKNVQKGFDGQWLFGVSIVSHVRLASVLTAIFICFGGAVPVSAASNATRAQLLSKDAPSYRPTSGHLIVGAPIKLSPALFAANAAGSTSLVTPSQARSAAIAMWTAWHTALDTNDTRALAQLAAPGPMLEGTIDNCAYPGDCLSGATQIPEMGDVEIAVPRQRSYPLYFLASVKTTNLVQNTGGLSQESPWMEIQILTKSSSTAPWQLSFDSGYNAPQGDVLPWLPFEFGAPTKGGKTTISEYVENPTYSSIVPVPQSSPPGGTTPVKVAASSYISQLATYWQSYKVTGSPPAQNFFLNGGDSSGEGVSLAENRQGSIYAGSRVSYSFTSDPPRRSVAIRGGRRIHDGVRISSRHFNPDASFGTVVPRLR